jgi:hypothetical protein
MLLRVLAYARALLAYALGTERLRTMPTVSRSIYVYIYILFCILSLCTFSSVVWGLFIQHENMFSLQKLLLPAVAGSSSLLLKRMKGTAGMLSSL